MPVTFERIKLILYIIYNSKTKTRWIERIKMFINVIYEDFLSVLLQPNMSIFTPILWLINVLMTLFTFNYDSYNKLKNDQFVFTI